MQQIKKLKDTKKKLMLDEQAMNPILLEKDELLLAFTSRKKL